MASKMGQPFLMDSLFRMNLNSIMETRGVRAFSLTWDGDAKDHMKWKAVCTNPKPKLDDLGIGSKTIIQYGSTPNEAVRKLLRELHQ